FSLNTSITSLSELLDIGRASLYRAFDKLCEDGLIEKDGRRIRIPDTEALLQAYQ
ncbi:MAG: winged helix-turn-helix domain-containing protein, partial [Clostridia bacterium]|nr:winged helix-turn-helix domain-containing protein [Clostridia bacterium]